MNKLPFTFLAFALLLFVFSCQKEVINEDTGSENLGTPSAQLLKGPNCSLEKVCYPKTTVKPFEVMAEDFCGSTSPYVAGIFDSYVDCLLGAPLAPDNCCPMQSLYLNWGGGTSTTPVMFEVWGLNKAGFTTNSLGDRCFSVAEQEAFLDRVFTAAQNATPVCNSGAYNAVAYEFEWVPFTASPSDAEIRVKVLYTPICLFPN